jgi:cysteine synthase A
MEHCSFFACSSCFDYNCTTNVIFENGAVMGPPQELLDRLVLAQRILRETLVIRLPHIKLELYAKLEFLNGVGSIKDRAAFWILKRAIERGEVSSNTTVVESSSGNFACALAVFCRILKLKFIAVFDPLLSPFYEAYLRAYCTQVVKVEESDDSGTYLRARLLKVQAFLREISDCYWTNQYENLDGVTAHYELTGAEICRAIPQLDYVFLGVSSAGTVAGVSQRLKEHYPTFGSSP